MVDARNHNPTASDARLLRLDFIAEAGDLLVTAGAAIASAASAERVDVLEIALRQARAILLDGIAEFKALGPKDGGVE
jgi:hypothetical protein